MNFNWRKGDIGIYFDSEKDQHLYYPQVVQYYHDEKYEPEKELQYTIGLWEKDKEGYEFRSVGNRFFESLIDKADLDSDYIKEVLSMCSAFGKLLDEWWQQNED